MYARFLQNHTLANLSFGLVLLLGSIAYLEMPREQDPSVNFNWVEISTVWPGASAEDVEKRVTDPLEDGIAKVADIRFVSSTSRPGVSSIVIRFNDIDADRFDKRMNDLRGEIQSQQKELPLESRQPDIYEITSANTFPMATLAVTGIAVDEALRKTAIDTRKDIERMAGVDFVNAVGQTDPEIHVLFAPDRLVGLGISPVDLADTVSAYFRDLAAGSVRVGDQDWFVHLVGTSNDPQYLASLPVVTALGELPLRSVADVVTGRSKPTELVSFNGQPAVMLSVFKKERANSLELLATIKDHIEQRNKSLDRIGVRLLLLDDQTAATHHTIGVMESNALVGLVLVLLVVWLFLGLRIAVFTSLGIPFALAGTFLILYLTGQTLNSATLLAAVISLGMLVDDAIVIAEAIYEQLRRGQEGIKAALAALREVGLPVATAVLTTIAAFVPLMLMPGVLGNYMRVVPEVVTLALVLSLVEGFWMLPAHMVALGSDPVRSTRLQRVRVHATAWLRQKYARLLLRALKRPRTVFALGIVLIAGAFGMVASGLVRVDFFASDLYPMFYINVEMPAGTPVGKTLSTLERIEAAIKPRLQAGETRSIISYAGQRYDSSELRHGDEKGQVFVSLNPPAAGRRGVDEIIDDLRNVVDTVPGPAEVSFLRHKLGPPILKPVSIKVRGDDQRQRTSAAEAIEGFLRKVPGILDLGDDSTRGRMELQVRLNPDAIVRAGVNPANVARVVRLYADGQAVASMQHQGEKLDVRVQARPRSVNDTQSFLDYPVGLRDGSEVALGKLVDRQILPTLGNIRHYNFRRTVTIEAEIDNTHTNVIRANQAVLDFWKQIRSRYPGIDIDVSGEMDDVQQSIGAMLFLFLAGLGLIYLILGAQFVSYRQPLMVLVAVPMAFVGVVIGLFLTGNPLSLYTIYGIVALAGISVNDAIVLISAANDSVRQGTPVPRAIVSAARRRLVPILITSLTTIAGLFSLAAGLAGKSLMWGPMATAMVWGLGLTLVLTLFLVPPLYLAVTKPRRDAEHEMAPLPVLPDSNPSPWKGILARLRGAVARETLTPDAIQDPAERQRYQDAVAAVDDGDIETAIREFQRLADQHPRSLLYSVAVTQVLLTCLQQNGWDLGYMQRASRYLARARRIDPEDRRVRQLERTYRLLDSTT